MQSQNGHWKITPQSRQERLRYDMGHLNASRMGIPSRIGCGGSSKHQKHVLRTTSKELMEVEPVKSGGKPSKIITSPGLPYPLPPPGAGPAGLVGKCLVVSLVRQTPGGYSWNQPPWTALRKLSCIFGESFCWFLLPFFACPQGAEGLDSYREIILKRFH